MIIKVNHKNSKGEILLEKVLDSKEVVDDKPNGRSGNKRSNKKSGKAKQSDD